MLTCCALHNSCKKHKESFDNTWEVTDSSMVEKSVAQPQSEDEYGRKMHDAVMPEVVRNPV